MPVPGQYRDGTDKGMALCYALRKRAPKNRAWCISQLERWRTSPPHMAMPKRWRPIGRASASGDVVHVRRLGAHGRCLRMVALARTAA